MDIKSVKKHLRENTSDLKKILKHFKFHSMNNLNGNIFCGKPNGDSKKSVSVKLDDNLTSSSFSIGYSGDLFGMIAKTHNMEWQEVLYICELIINKKIETSEEITIFDGFLESVYVSQEHQILTYSDDELNNFENIWNYRFVEDYIFPKTQREFEIMYCPYEDRITIPWRNDENLLVGIMGRANFKTDLRYFPIIAFAKSYHLYGLHKTKKYIGEMKTAYIGEAEKFTMQLWNYGYKNGVSLGCSTISQRQVELLLKYGCKNFVLCLDEGSNTEVIRRNIEMIKECLFMRDDCKIGILLDRKNEIMKEGSKCSPSDLGKDNWEKLISNHIKWREIK